MEKVVGALAVFIFAPIFAAYFFSEFNRAYPNFWDNLFFWGTIGAVLYVAARLTPHIREQMKESRYKRDADFNRAQQQQILAATVMAESFRLHQLASIPVLKERQFVELTVAALDAELKRTGIPLPTRDLAEKIIRATGYVYRQITPPPLPAYQPSKPFDQTYELNMQSEMRPRAAFMETYHPKKITAAFVKCYWAFLAALPPPREGPFKLPISEQVDVKQLLSEMTAPFSALAVHDKIPNEVATKLHEGAVRALAEMHGKLPIYPSQYEGIQDPVELYLHPMLQPLLWHELPWGIEDETRYMHHHCLGAFGSGKTTFLSHFIFEDFNRVVRGEASLVVMDSQRLVSQLSRLKIFAPGNPLFDRVVIIDTDEHYPIALNPFALGKGMGTDMLSYAFTGMTATTDQTEEALDWTIKAASAVEGANFNTLVQLLRPQKGEWQFPFDVELDQNTKDYFDFLFPKTPASTKNAALRRLYTFQKNKAVTRMLNADSCSLDFFEEFQKGGKVFLIDTDRAGLQKEGTEIFGRLFLFLLDQVSNRRGSYSEASLKPVFVVIDECHDYIARDPVFADMIFKARNKRIALTLAHHSWEQIENNKTAVGLKQTAIHSHCIRRGQPIEVSMGGHVHHLPISKVDWNDPMSEEEYHTLRQHIFAKYGATKKAEPPPFIPQDDGEVHL